MLVCSRRDGSRAPRQSSPRSWVAEGEGSWTDDLVGRAVPGDLALAHAVVVPVDAGDGAEAQEVEDEAGKHADLGRQVVGRCGEPGGVSARSACAGKGREDAPSLGR